MMVGVGVGLKVGARVWCFAPHGEDGTLVANHFRLRDQCSGAAQHVYLSIRLLTGECSNIGSLLMCFGSHLRRNIFGFAILRIIIVRTYHDIRSPSGLDSGLPDAPGLHGITKRHCHV